DPQQIQQILNIIKPAGSPGQQEEQHVEGHMHPPQEHMEPNNAVAITIQNEASQMEEDPKDEPILTKEEVPNHLEMEIVSESEKEDKKTPTYTPLGS
ncbi:15498_t:CDS:1, partial [Acaulospora morrowiae]